MQVGWWKQINERFHWKEAVRETEINVHEGLDWGTGGGGVGGVVFNSLISKKISKNLGPTDLTGDLFVVICLALRLSESSIKAKSFGREHYLFCNSQTGLLRCLSVKEPEGQVSR